MSMRTLSAFSSFWSPSVWPVAGTSAPKAVSDQPNCISHLICSRLQLADGSSAVPGAVSFPYCYQYY